MHLTREADYALRAMLDVASQPTTTPTTTAAIAARRLVPHPFLRRIVRRLIDAGLLRAIRGRRGGLLLAKPAAEIDLLTILTAVGTTVAVNHCVLQPDRCPLQPTCPIHEICRETHAAMVQILSGVHLDQLVERQTQLVTNRQVASRSDARTPDLPIPLT